MGPIALGLSDSERRVLQIIWLNGPMPRHEIAERSGLGGASITRLTRDLEQRGLVSDSILREGKLGQPTRPVAVRGAGAYAFGVNFSHSYIEAGLIDLTGELVSRERASLDRADVETIAGTSAAMLEAHARQHNVPADRIVGAGFSVPGDFGETPTAFQAHAAFPHLRGRDLRAEFAARVPVPVFVENDAASAALGERIHGACRRIDSFLFVHVGHGVGGGVVLNGQLHRGAHGNAGILGMLYPMSQPRPSGQDLLDTLSAAGVEAFDFDALEPLTPESNAPLRRWLARAGGQLGEGLQIAARILDPLAIVVGGRLPPALADALVASIDFDVAFAESRHLPRPSLHVSSLGSFAGVIGAASVCMFDTFFADRDKMNRNETPDPAPTQARLSKKA